MGQRDKQHMGRSTDDDRDLVGRDIRDDDLIAGGPEHDDIPRPNEEGTNFRPDQPLDRTPGRGATDRGDGSDRGGSPSRGDDARR
ncbi:MAG: hypothetical protein ACYC2G_15890 [Gemmatimonadaceae bacterium]